MIALSQRHRVCFSRIVLETFIKADRQQFKVPTQQSLHHFRLSPNGANNSAITSQGGTERLHFIDDYIIYRTVRYHILNPSRVMVQPLRERLLLT